MALVGGDESTRFKICRRLAEEHGIQTFHEPRAARPLTVVGHAPVRAIADELNSKPELANGDLTKRRADVGNRWVSAFVPPLVKGRSPDGDTSAKAMDGGSPESNADNHLPRLIARIQNTTAATRWPAPHQMWPSGWQWPEYRLEIDDIDWAISEVVSALDSMRCPVHAVTDDGSWWN